MNTIPAPMSRRSAFATHLRPVAAAAVLALASLAPASVRANSYTVVDLGKQMLPRQINDAGQIAGLTGKTEKAIEFHGGRWRYLQSPSAIGIAGAIDARGDVVGEQSNAALMWERFGHVAVLPLPDGAVFSEATGVTGGRVVSGYYQTMLGGATRCFMTQPGGSAVDLGLPGHGDRCITAGINKHSQIVGTADREPGGPNRAFLWQLGAFHDLGTLGGRASIAFAVNDRGQVVGESATVVGGQTHAFFFAGGRMHDIGASTKFFKSRAMAIGNSRSGRPEIVGIGYDPDGQRPRAVRFDPDLGPVELDDEIGDRGDWRLFYAFGVNDAGVIVGQGQRADGPHGFMLVPQAGR